MFLQSIVDRLSEIELRVLRFIIAGGMGAGTNFVTLYVLTEFFGVWYLISAGISLAAGFTVSFILQKFWTFQNNSLERVHVQIPMHVALGFSNLGVNTVALYILVEWFGIWYMLAQLLTAICLACLNYYMYKTHIFRPE